jgi:hypothetical protein
VSGEPLLDALKKILKNAGAEGILMISTEKAAEGKGKIRIKFQTAPEKKTEPLKP